MILKKNCSINNVVSTFAAVLFFFICISAVQTVTSQITVHINSGNPVYPFPQFQPYQNSSGKLENLATRSGVGVTHLEMEQTIRDAYQIMMNRASAQTGGVGTKKYIKFSSNPQCSEGDGYALLGAASMADKETFDGLWLYIHDFTMNKVKRYSDCKESSPGYAYSHLPGWTGSGANSATDGDVDIGFALLCAYLQWGEFMGVKDACGDEISYKKEAIEFLKGLTDTIVYSGNGLNYICGDIGLDGYIKGGDSWTELTDWASDKARSGLPRIPEAKGPAEQHIDYTAPSYFHAFAEFLTKEDPVLYAWNIKQFQRCEASSDWLMGQMLTNEKMIPFAGWVSLSANNTPTFTNFNEGEDFRLAWRTILNNMWYGNPSSTWDPVSHQVKSGTANTYERDIGSRYAKFLWDSRQAPWNNAGTANVGGDSKNTLFWGPEVLKQYYSPLGEPLGTFALNWVPGTGSPSAVVAQNFNLMTELFRSLEMKWDSESGGRYLTSVPHYFHEWFRLMGLLTLSGNYQAASQFKPTANTKVYLAIDKTFAFEGDSLTYSIDYRNFGSLDAKDVTIVDTLHKDFIYVSSTGGGVYNAASNTVTWNVATLPGFKTATGITPTVGQVKLTVKVGIASEKQYRNRVSISCSNGSGWVSNEYPNHIETVMERNYLDIAKRALVLKKSVSNPQVNPGKEVQFSIDFENTSEAGWINGGRSGVHFAYSHSPAASGSLAMMSMRMKLFNDANEAYIDYGNYRVSYFLFDAGLSCYTGDNGCTTGWDVKPIIIEGVDKNFVKIKDEVITAGQDDHGKWNQRIIVQFSDPTDSKRTINLTTTNYHLDWYTGSEGYIHRGGTYTLRLVWNINASTWTNTIWNDDWSWDPAADGGDASKCFPVTNDWTDPDKPDIPVTTWNPKEISTAPHTVNNVLVEEWDGYTWRRVAGNGPLPGRDVSSVIIRDTIPAGLTFSKFVGEAPLGIAATVSGNVITWKIPKLQIKQKGSLKYIATASGSCPMQSKNVMTRTWISADKESAIYDSAAVLVTCDSVAPPPPSATTMYKSSDKPVYHLGDTVTYKIAYKQTHGSFVKDASNIDEWIDKTGKGKFSIKKDTITFDKQSTMMVQKYSYGVNGIFGGTIQPSTYSDFSLVFRSSGSDYVEIRLRKENDMVIKFFNTAQKIGADQHLTYNGFSSGQSVFNFKVKISGDTVSLWAGDTSALMPNVTQTGIAVREGNAGVRSTADFGQAKVWGWNSHLDVAFDLTIHDKLPKVLAYKSSGGSVVTGKNAGKQLVGTNNNGDILWNVVSGEEFLSAGDSVNVWIKATLDDCTGDTIFNTAYTNIRGYPTDYIGARARATCSNGDEGKPHHVSIILDTTNFNRTNDEILDPIALGSNQKTYTIFAVVRDKPGNFLRFANDATWGGGNSNIATASASADGKRIGIITNVGPGTTIINVNEPGLIGDSVEVNIMTTAAWPVIKSAVMLDKNGDLTPDMLSISLTSDFESSQKLDSISIEYKGNLYSIPASSVVKQGVNLSVPFTSLTGVDGRPSGRVTMYLTADGNIKQSRNSFIDGVGPALSSAEVFENNGGAADILFLTFSEPVVPSFLMGNQLLLIKAGTADTIILNIGNVTAIQSDSQVSVQVSGSTKRPVAGDALRLVPGSKNGEISDLNTNRPHDQNHSVVLTLKQGPAAISSVYYYDFNADGNIDSVRICFKRTVQISELASLSLHWNIQSSFKIEPLKIGDIKKVDDSTYLLPANGMVMSSGKILTNPGMEISVVFVSSPDQSVNKTVSDSAAPVAISAQILPGSFTSSSTRLADTLTVTISEKIKEPFNSDPFLFASKKGNGSYKLKLNYIGSQGATYRFSIEQDNSESAVMPSSGDSLWINPSAEISDIGGAVQDNQRNRHVLIEMIRPAANWHVLVGPNPFIPDKTEVSSEFPGKLEKRGVGIKVKPTTPIELDNIEVFCTIYDILGNTVISNELMPQGDSFYWVWNGYNNNHRAVGAGTYGAIIVITEEHGKQVLKQKISVRR